jgi:hypothetical protein
MLRKTEFITLKLYEKSFLSFRRSKATEKSEQKERFLPAVEMTKTLFIQSPIEI